MADPSAFNKHAYSFEELIAECGAALLCAQGGISAVTFDNSAAYIASWIKALKDDPKMIVNASGQAAKAADFVLGKSEQVIEVEAA